MQVFKGDSNKYFTFDSDVYWSFVKSPVNQSMKCKACSNFQMSFLHLSQTDSPIDEALGQVDIFLRSLGQADLWSDIPPGSGI